MVDVADDLKYAPWAVYANRVDGGTEPLGVDDGNGGDSGGLGMFGAHVLRLYDIGGVQHDPGGLYSVSSKRLRFGYPWSASGSPAPWKAEMAGVIGVGDHYSYASDGTWRLGLSVQFGDRGGNLFKVWYDYVFFTWGVCTYIMLLANPSGPGIIYIKEPKVVATFRNWNWFSVLRGSDLLNLSGPHAWSPSGSLGTCLQYTYTPEAGDNTLLRAALGNPDRGLIKIQPAGAGNKYLRAYGSNMSWSSTGYEAWANAANSRRLPDAGYWAGRVLGGDWPERTPYAIVPDAISSRDLTRVKGWEIAHWIGRENLTVSFHAWRGGSGVPAWIDWFARLDGGDTYTLNLCYSG